MAAGSWRRSGWACWSLSAMSTVYKVYLGLGGLRGHLGLGARLRLRLRQIVFRAAEVNSRLTGTTHRGNRRLVVFSATGGAFGASAQSDSSEFEAEFRSRAFENNGKPPPHKRLTSSPPTQPTTTTTKPTSGNGNRDVRDTIPDVDVLNHVDDITVAKRLVKETLQCQECEKRILFDVKVEGIDYCKCGCGKPKPRAEDSTDIANGAADEGWTPFLERKDVIVWRRANGTGLYEYKMYGRFEDVTAEEFLAVQMDLSEYRKHWDQATSQCQVLSEWSSGDAGEDRGESLQGPPRLVDVSQVYYWEVFWPKFFANRDYCCLRRTCVYGVEDDDLGNARSFQKVVMISRSTFNSACPEKSCNFRVRDFSSVMTLQPLLQDRQQHRPEPSCGVEFSITATEDPGLSLPSYITTWVAIRAMPEYMANLRAACLELRRRGGAAGGGGPLGPGSFLIRLQDSAAGTGCKLSSNSSNHRPYATGNGGTHQLFS